MRALLSVHDKTGLLPFARFLSARAFEIVSTGGTLKHLVDGGIKAVSVESVTGFPECLDGRVKTLHPAIHAGLLALRDKTEHVETLKRLKIETIDLLAVNLYPFFEKAKDKTLAFDELIEFIDIGGPAMLRSAAKNFKNCVVLTTPADYNIVIEAGGVENVSFEARRRLAGKVFGLTSAYDAAISSFLLENDKGEPPLERKYWNMSLINGKERGFPALRYGENPHQSAALFLNASGEGAFCNAEQLAGKPLSFNNIRDADFAWKAACGIGEGSACCVAVKHLSPCGAALGASALEAYQKTYDCDSVSIFGGVVAFNTTVDESCAKELSNTFLEIVMALDFSPVALEILKAKKDLRIMRMPTPPVEKYEAFSFDGGILVQERDSAANCAYKEEKEKWEVVTKATLCENDIPDMRFAMKVAAFVRSNAIVVCKDLAAVGIGGGQTNRLDAAECALKRAAGKGARVLASDAFFPFPDVVELARAHGIKSIIQPGGSLKDGASIEVCDKYGIAMVFTGVRHFKH